MFGQHTACYSYFDGHSSSSILDAVESLREFVSAEGAFDGVIGFSQGAVLAATLMIIAQADPNRQALAFPFRCAIFLCGGLPFDLAALTEGKVRQIEPTESQTPLIRVPVVNCWAANDTDYPGMGPDLAKLCWSQSSREVIHGVGHGIPAEGEDLRKLHAAIDDMLRSVNGCKLLGSE